MSKDTPYTDAQISAQLDGLPGWSYKDNAIRRVYETDGWPVTLMLVNALAVRAIGARDLADQLLGKRPGDRGVDLDADLVGLEAGDRLVGSDRRGDAAAGRLHYAEA